MLLEEKKDIIKSALIESFVDDYESYKNTIELINKDFKKSKIKYKYKYDEFCIDFLNQSLKNIEIIDIFKSNTESQFYIDFYRLNVTTLYSMLNDKLNDLGYNFNDLKTNSKKRLN